MYRQLHVHFWTDPKILKISPTGKLIFLYLISCPIGDSSGIFNFSVGAACEHLGLDLDTLSKGLQELEAAELVAVDSDSRSIWVINGFRYQGSGEKHIRHAEIHLQSIHSKRLAEEFAKKYRIKYRRGIEGASEVGRIRIEQEQEIEQEGRKKTKESCPEQPTVDSVPPELADLSLYRSDRRLCRAWSESFQAWKTAYPAVDILAQVRKAHAWEVDNPKNRKANRTRFLGAWLSKEQDRAAKIPVTGTPPRTNQEKPPDWKLLSDLEHGIIGKGDRWYDAAVAARELKDRLDRAEADSRHKESRARARGQSSENGEARPISDIQGVI